MRSTPLLLVALLMSVTPAAAATDQECQSQWKTIDVDANGGLEASEDTKGYIAAIEKSGVKLMKPGVVSRDEFLTYCKKSGTTITTESPSNTKDFGKGDLTPGKSPLAQVDVQKKLEANGFKNIRDLRLDDKGIWHATAFADGKDKPVSVDPQGDIVGQETVAPLQDRGTGTMATDRTTSPAVGEMNSAAAQTERGSVPSSGLYLWLFLLIGNAAAVLFLNGVGGPTSAMSNSTLTRAERM
jgi:hypothetical protein